MVLSEWLTDTTHAALHHQMMPFTFIPRLEGWNYTVFANLRLPYMIDNHDDRRTMHALSSGMSLIYYTRTDALSFKIGSSLPIFNEQFRCISFI